MLEEDQGRWLSYQELGEVIGCAPNAARMHAERRKWPRRASNRIGELARVLVPEDVIVRPRALHAVEQFDAECNAPVPVNGHTVFDAQNTIQAIREAVEILVKPLREQLTQADRDAARLRAELIDLLISERSAVDLAEYASAEVADLRRRLDTAEEERRRLTDQQGIERDRADRIEQQLTKVEGELIAARVEAASLQCQLELAHPKAVPDSPRSGWRRLLA
jgi:hypothetical protein